MSEPLTAAKNMQLDQLLHDANRNRRKADIARRCHDEKAAAPLEAEAARLVYTANLIDVHHTSDWWKELGFDD